MSKCSFDSNEVLVSPHRLGSFEVSSGQAGNDHEDGIVTDVFFDDVLTAMPDKNQMVLFFVLRYDGGFKPLCGRETNVQKGTNLLLTVHIYTFMFR